MLVTESATAPILSVTLTFPSLHSYTILGRTIRMKTAYNFGSAKSGKMPTRSVFMALRRGAQSTHWGQAFRAVMLSESNRQTNEK